MGERLKFTKAETMTLVIIKGGGLKSLLVEKGCLAAYLLQSQQMCFHSFLK